MSIRRTAKARRGAAAVALAVGLLLAVAGCGGGEGSEPRAETPEQSGPGKNNNRESQDDESSAPDDAEVIAELQGEKGMVLSVTEAKRDSGGFLTVSGFVRNDGDKGYFDTTKWQGNEKEIVGNGYSLGGAALVDQEGKKRYYVLRDTEGRCLCTTGITKVDPGKEVAIFAQFPAPPEETEQIEFTLPTFDAATVEITPSE